MPVCERRPDPKGPGMALRLGSGSAQLGLGFAGCVGVSYYFFRRRVEVIHYLVYWKLEFYRLTLSRDTFGRAIEWTAEQADSCLRDWV